MGPGSAADPGSAPGPGPFATCRSPSLALFPVALFGCPVSEARKGPKNIIKKKKNQSIKLLYGTFKQIRLQVEATDSKQGMKPGPETASLPVFRFMRNG